MTFDLLLRATYGLLSLGFGPQQDLKDKGRMLATTDR